MKITRVDLYQLDIPLEKPKRYPNKTYEALDDTIVRIATDEGHAGWAEVCPIATTYQPEHALGVRAAMEEIVPGLIGEDPTQTDRINEKMNQWLMGAEYAKSAIDIACWDLCGKAYNRPLYRFLGGRLLDRAAGYPEIEAGQPGIVTERIAQYRNEGFRHFQLKVGRGSNFDLDVARLRYAADAVRPGETLVADANKAWSTHEALRILRATEDIDYYIEQPCLTYEECLSIRRQVRQPMILDECMTDIRLMLRGLSDNCFEGIGCKITRVGGITGTKLIRDVCKAAGKIMTVDDAWGSDLSAAAQAHIAVSTPARTFFATYVSTYFSKVRYDLEAPMLVDGYLNTNEKPGLGVDPDMSILGEPVRTFA